MESRLKDLAERLDAGLIGRREFLRKSVVITGGTAAGLTVLRRMAHAQSGTKLRIWLFKSYVTAGNDVLAKQVEAWAAERKVQVDMDWSTFGDREQKFVAAIEAGNPPDMAEMNYQGPARYKPALRDVTKLAKDIAAARGGLLPYAERVVKEILADEEAAREGDAGHSEELTVDVAAHHDALQGIGASEAGQKEDRLAIPSILVRSDAFPVVTLTLIDAEPLGQDGLAFHQGGGHTEVEDGPADPNRAFEPRDAETVLAELRKAAGALSVTLTLQMIQRRRRPWGSRSRPHCWHGRTKSSNEPGRADRDTFTWAT